MRTAIISDIHGNLLALEIVLHSIEQQSIDRMICLGDFVEGGDHNDAVIALIKSKGYQAVRGNHDEINACCLEESHQAWLSSLPEMILEDDVIFTHISPRRKRLIISDNIEAWNVFDEEEFRLCFIGHTHFPIIFGDKNDSFGEAMTYNIDEGIFNLENTDRYIVSFGAVGYPRRGGNFIRYGIYDSASNRLEFIKLDGPLLPYGLNI